MPGASAFGLPWDDGEGRAAVLPQDAGLADRHAAAPVEIEALQDAGASALPIDDAVEDSIAGPERLRPGKRPSHGDGSGRRREPIGVQPFLDRLGGEVRVGDGVAGEEGALHRLDAEVDVVGASGAEGGADRNAQGCP